MPANIGSFYIGRIAEISGRFYSVNQEQAAQNAGYSQLVVPQLIGKSSRYKRLSRDLFWIRDGYIEEVYTCGTHLR